jgi:hypothetical protein
MSDLTDWIQSYWFELTSLAIQLAILVVLQWFAQTALKLLAAREPRAEAVPEPSQHHSGLVASLTTSPSRASVAATQDASGPHIAEPGFAGVGRMLLPIPESAGPEPAIYHRAEGPNPLKSVIRWLQQPINPSASVAWRRVLRPIS